MHLDVVLEVLTIVTLLAELSEHIRQVPQLRRNAFSSISFTLILDENMQNLIYVV